MKPNQHTIIFVPHARAKFRKWRFTSLQAALLCGSIVLLSMAGIVATYLLLDSSFDRQQLEQISEENRALRQVNQNFESSVDELEQQLADYQDRIHKLAIVAGLAELSPNAEAGIGGSDPGSDEFDALHGRLEEIGHGMSLLQEQFERQAVQISSTPAIRPVEGILTSGFGYRTDPFTKRRAFHRGLDFIAPPGQDVVATADGVVTLAGRAQGLGVAVYLSHGFGVSSRYGHLSRLAVKAGDRVKRGDVIGYVGNTGRSTGYHLHYEVHLDGKAANPLGYILDTAR